MTPHDALKEAIRILGTQKAVAAASGPDVGTAHVYHWLYKAPEVPAKYCPGIESATRAKGETVFCEQLCPGTDWAVVRKQSGPVALAVEAEAPTASDADDGPHAAIIIRPTTGTDKPGAAHRERHPNHRER